MLDLFSKKKLTFLENKYFMILLLINLIGLLIEIITYTYFYISKDYYINFILVKINLLYYMFFMANLFIYYYVLTNKIKSKNNEKFIRTKKIVSIIYFILIVILMLFPKNLSVNNNNIFTSGDEAYFTYFTGLVTLIIIFYLVTKNKKKVSKKNNIILLTILLLGFLSVIIQFYFPEVLLIVGVHTLVLLMIYFNVENPDLKLIKELKKAKSIAQKSNKAKSDFLSNISHEIRTPLNAIIGFSDYIYNSDNSKSEFREEIQNINIASHTLLEIIGNILDINKIEHNKEIIRNEIYNPKEILKEVIEINESRIKNKDIKLDINITKNIPNNLIGDKKNIKIIFSNLISNAMKYTINGTITIILDYKKEKLIFSVQDTGIGIKKKDFNKLFKKFVRLNIENNATIEGTGLGLAITKKLINTLGGKITVESIENKGSTFKVKIPQKTSEKNIQEINYNIVSNKKNINSLNILVVDDNELNLKIVEKFLGNKITKARNGIECINYVKKHKFDIILLDIMMPGDNGDEVLKKLKKNKNFKIPVIAFSADAISGSEDKYKKLGFDDYISKPFKKDDLIDKIYNLTNKSNNV